MDAAFTSPLSAAVRIATPLIMGSLGGLISERSGVFAVGIEGMMLGGAFGASIAALMTGHAISSPIYACLAGVLIAALAAVAITRFSADQMVTGLAINTLSYGLTGFLIRGLFGGQAPTIRINLLPVIPVPILSKIPVLGPIFFEQPILTYAALLLTILLHFFLYRTNAGLRLRATGENPEAVYAAGSDPVLIRQIAVVACGGLAGLGGAVLVLQDVGTFTDGMTGGRGFLALAALVVGRWTPLGALVSCLLFGLASALEIRVQGVALPVNSYMIQMLPYAIALLVLTALGRGTRMPQAIGRAYRAD
jgi:ABC-type uncharacterized transport system permease subunit